MANRHGEYVKKSTLDLPAIPDLRSDPEYAEAAGLLTAFEEKRREINDRILLLTIEHHFATRPKQSSSGNDADLRYQERKLRDALSKTSGKKPSVTDADQAPEIVAGIRLLRGEHIPPQPDRPSQIAKLREQLAVVDNAIMALAPVIEAVRSQKNFELSQRLAAYNNELTLNHYRACVEVVRSVAALRNLHTSVVRAGYGELRSDIAPETIARATLLLGLESESDSQVSTLRRHLEQRGIL